MRTCPALLLPLCCLLLVLSLLQNPRPAWARPSNAARALTRARPPPAEPSMLCHVNTEDGTLNREHHDAHGSPQDTGATSAELGRRPGQLPRLGPCPPLHSVLSTVVTHYIPPIRGGDDDFRSPRTCTLPVLESIKGGGGLLCKGVISSHLALHPQNTHSLTLPDIGTCLNLLAET